MVKRKRDYDPNKKAKLDPSIIKPPIAPKDPGFSLPVHGNWVGPGWSAGKKQSSVIDESIPSVDAFDEAAKQHDQAYAWTEANVTDPKQKQKMLENADKQFTEALNKDQKDKSFWDVLKHPIDAIEETASAGAVNVQRMWRDITTKDPDEDISNMNPYITPDKKPKAKEPNVTGSRDKAKKKLPTDE